MGKKLHFSKAKKGPLDTLEITSEFSKSECDFAQNPDGIQDLEKSDEITFDRDGKSTQSNLKRRSRSKFFNNHLAARLASLDSRFKEKYWDTYHCSDIVTVEGDKAKSRFCRKRWCVICNRIRTAHLVQTYYPTLKTWPDKQFVTLTVPNPKLAELKDTLSQMYQAFTQIKDSERKANRKLVGLRKLEVTYNRHEDTYHPHFHLVTESSRSCDQIIKKWLKKFPDAKEVAQDSRTADDHSCFELFKYFTKLTSNSGKDKMLSVAALDNIFLALDGVRVFQPFGFVAHKEVPAPEDVTLGKDEQELVDTWEYKYLQELHDWYCLESGDALTGYEPSSKDEQARACIL
jgi:hypothetical protein